MSTRRKALLAGGIVAGVLDIAYAILFYWFRNDVSPVRILQSVASGLLGNEAYSGGVPVAILGLALHFVIALTAAAIYFLASRWLPLLVRRPLFSGVVFGLCVYAFMNWVVIPLSRMGPRPWPPTDVLVTGVLVHMFFVGLPIALACRWAVRKEAGGDG